MSYQTDAETGDNSIAQNTSDTSKFRGQGLYDSGNLPTMDDPQQQRKVKILSIILLVLVPVAVIYTIVMQSIFISRLARGQVPNQIPNNGVTGVAIGFIVITSIYRIILFVLMFVGALLCVLPNGKYRVSANMLYVVSLSFFFSFSCVYFKNQKSLNFFFAPTKHPIYDQKKKKIAMLFSIFGLSEIFFAIIGMVNAFDVFLGKKKKKKAPRFHVLT